MKPSMIYQRGFVCELHKLEEVTMIYAQTEERAAEIEQVALKMPSRACSSRVNPDGRGCGAPDGRIEEKFSYWQPGTSGDVAPQYPN